MEVRQYIRPDITVSAIVHVSLVAFVVIHSEVRPFRTLPETVVPVDVIVVDDKKPDPLPTPTPSPRPDFSLAAKPPSPQGSAATVPEAASPPQPSQMARAARREESVQPQAQAPSAARPAAPAYTRPEPDLTVKYHVMLGLPENMPASAPSSEAPAASSGDRSGEGGDTSPATENLGSSLVDVLRSHLRTCSKLPAGLSPTDSVAVKLRVQMKTDGRLAAEPALIEGTASIKGVELMRAAIAALSACQPYAMLPADRYGEWKVLELSFTPRDFS